MGAIGDWRTAREAAGDVIESSAIAALVSRYTESPIETIFGAAAAKMLVSRYGPELCFCTQEHETEKLSERAVMIPQYVWQRFRIDWAFRFKNLPRPLVFVECDGAEFHSTLEQIERDRAKDAAAHEAGIPLIRFTGSDITRDPAGCVRKFTWRAWGGFQAP